MIEAKNIIVRLPNWIGDFIMALPVLDDLRKNFPKAKITAMCLKAHVLLLKNNKNIDDVFTFDKASIFSKRGFWIIKDLKEKKYDLGILLTNSFSSAFFFYMAKIKQRLGYKAHFRSFLLNLKVSLAKEGHLVSVYKGLLKKINIQPQDSAPKLFLEKKAMQNAKKALLKAGYSSEKLIGINPFAAYGSAKCWPLENFKKTAEILLKEGYFIVFFGDKRSEEKIESLINGLNKTVSFAGKTDLEELGALIKNCHLFLTNDSGPMHMAAALGVPTLALFGSTDDTRTGPYKTGRVIRKKTLCAPCFRRECNRDFSCMRKIEVNEVVDTIKEMLCLEN